MTNWDEIDHFDRDEFDDPDFPGSGDNIDFTLVYNLNTLREKTGWPIIIHNKFGVHGAVCMNRRGHSPGSPHYYPECSAADFHFEIDAHPREQAKKVIQHGFGRVGTYYGQMWDNWQLSIAFHVDMRERFQLWQCWRGMYQYLLK